MRRTAGRLRPLPRARWTPLATASRGGPRSSRGPVTSRRSGARRAARPVWTGRRRGPCTRRRPRVIVWASDTATPGRPCSRANAAACSLPLPTSRALWTSTQSTSGDQRRHPRRRAAASRATGRMDAGCRPGRPARGPTAIVSAADRPGRSVARGRRRSGRRRAVRTSSPTMTVSPSGAASRARSAPSIRSWSVIARCVSPRDPTRPGRPWPGRDRLSNDADVWQCRSMKARGARVASASCARALVRWSTRRRGPWT